MSKLLKKRAAERADALERRARGEDGSGDEGGEEVEELAAYKVKLSSSTALLFLAACVYGVSSFW